MINPNIISDTHVDMDVDIEPEQSRENKTENHCISISDEYLLVGIENRDCNCAHSKDCGKHKEVALPNLIRKSIRELLQTSLMLGGMLIIINGSNIIPSINIYVSFAICLVIGITLGLLMVFCNLKPYQIPENPV
ncbi:MULTISPECIES: hypothetical protein [Candidatus Ichthyocystis]|uniref:Putative membrane protein n=1 Tax=Candidatus Ichthyocystis hellenicum TaxID=1561003 RepID=A0A0S4M051_9BURK|nr:MULTISPECIES: hypothetical protein [Ichthyocystis]CUT17118.1 putative membrane protein [Candidatus Ichthyocystis hellenicum]